MAPIAPCFAEECWVALHYGVLDEDVEYNWKVSDEVIEAELSEHHPELLHHPKQGRPETLRSIFDQPFPDLEPSEIIGLLRSPTLISKARAKMGSE
jgi:hypothetical protein